MNDKSQQGQLYRFFDELATESRAPAPRVVAPDVRDIAEFARIFIRYETRASASHGGIEATRARAWRRVISEVQSASPSPSSSPSPSPSPSLSPIGAEPIATLQGQRRQSQIQSEQRTWGWTSRARVAGVLGVVLLMTLATALFFRGAPGIASASELLRKADTATSFVPAGKVRHIVTTFTDSINGDASGLTSEVWLTNGQYHLLSWQPALKMVDGGSLPPPMGDYAQLVSDDAVYGFHLSENKVYKAPYNPGASAGNDNLPNRKVSRLVQTPESLKYL